MAGCGGPGAGEGRPGRQLVRGGRGRQQPASQELRNAQEQVSTLQAELAAQDEVHAGELCGHQQRVRTLEDEVVELRATAADKDALLQQAGERVNALQAELAAKDAVASALEGEAAERKQQVKDAGARVSALQADLAAARGRSRAGAP